MGTWRGRWACSVVVTCLLAMAACGRPPGVDGDLTNNWPAFPEPRMSVPVLGECQDGDNGAWDIWWSGKPLQSVDCSSPHVLEVAYVGQFTGPAAARSAAPTPDSDDARAAYAECDRAARNYVGGDWHTGRLGLYLTPPTTAQWAGGARFFSCALYETSSLRGGTNKRTGTVKGGLTGDRPLAMRCFDLVGTHDADGFTTELQDTIPEGCEVPHTAEYAGVYIPPDGPYPADSDMDRLFSPRCVSIAAGFVGLSSNGFADRTDLGYAWWVASKEQWALGDRALTCFVTVSTEHPVRGSLEGLGGRPLPS